MSKGKKAGKSGKKTPPKRNTKEPAKKETPKPVESTRATRGSSRAPAQETAAQKRKASPSPAPKKTATPAKKARAASPSPVPATRHPKYYSAISPTHTYDLMDKIRPDWIIKFGDVLLSDGEKIATEHEKDRQGRPSRGASAPAPKVEARQSRSASQKKGEVKPTRVTRAVVEEVETRKTTSKPADKSRSSSRNKAPATPVKETATPKKGKEAATPKQVKETVTPKQTKEKATPKLKETPRGRSSTPRSATPKAKETPRGRSATPKTKQQQKTPPAKAKAAASKSRSVTPKATTPKQKAATPKQKTETVKEKTTPKQKTPTPKKITPSKKASPAKTTPKKASPRKSATPTKQEEIEDLSAEDARESPAEKKLSKDSEKATEETGIEKELELEPEPVEAEIADKDESVLEKEEGETKETDSLEAEKEEEEEEEEEEAMDVDEEPSEVVGKQQEITSEEADIENDVADDEINEPMEQETEAPKETESEEAHEEPDVEEKEPEGEEQELEAEEAPNELEAEEKEAATLTEQADTTENEKLEEEDAEQEVEDADEIEEEEVEEIEQEPEENISEEPEAEKDMEEVEGVATLKEQEPEESTEEPVIQESAEQVDKETEDIQEAEVQEEGEALQASETGEVISEGTDVSSAQIADVLLPQEKEELEKASVVAQADETEQMEELVAGLGDGESDIVSGDNGSVRESLDENGSGDTGDTGKFETEVIYQEAVQEVPQTGYPVVEVPDGHMAESEINTTGIEIAQEVSEVSGVSGDMVNDTEGVMPIQMDEATANLSNGEQPSISSPTKRKHDEVEEEEFKSSKKPRLSEEIEYTEKPFTNGEGSAESEDVMKEYVVIDMADVPPPECQEVVDSVPKETVHNFTSEEAVITEQKTVDQIETNITQTVSDTNPVYTRVFIPNPHYIGAGDSSKQFSLVSYNILADCHLFRYDYSFTEPDYLEPDYRLNKLVEEIQYLDGDVVCLQEVDPDFFQDQLLPSMKNSGYEGFHHKRTEDFFDEGEATFFKTERFALVDVSKYRIADLVEKEFVDGMDPTIQAAVREYMNRPDVLVVTRLRCQHTGQEVTIGNIHVTWGEMKVPDVQSLQIACAIKELVQKAGSDACPHIICGDFNSEPLSAGYLMAKDGYLSDEGTITKLQQLTNLQLPEDKAESLVNCMWSAFQHTSSSLKSVYLEAAGAEPAITSYNRGMCACVDYMFYSSTSLDAVGVLQTAAKDRIMETGGTPNCYFPSDHVSLKSVFSFK